MKLVTKESDYAIRAVLFLAQNNDRYVSSREIAEKDNIPLRFLRKILIVLKNKKLIETKEGKTGGIKLKEKADKISLKDLITFFQGNIQFTECLFRGEICHNRATCVLRKRILNIEEKVVKEFEKITIKTLINDFNHE
ncbi:MAG: Rrf2 family transcriptional regulator [Chlamydiae bacterium]|nr:MAG: Rrf2 family transcriptional regulator [Chlamydiota bacterium]